MFAGTFDCLGDREKGHVTKSECKRVRQKKMAARVLTVSVALLSSLGADGIGREDDT